MPSHLALFLLATVVLILTPGPAMLYIFARSLSQGRAAGLASVAGIAVGDLFHALGAALGVSAIIASSVLAFSVLKYAGAAYLVYLGIRKFRSPPLDPTAAELRREPLRAIFRQGAFVGIFNPKPALFFLSFLPQFADPARGSVPLQLLAYGLTFVLLAALGNATFSLLAGRFGTWLKERPAFLRNERYVSGSVYCGLGLAAALSGPPAKSP